MYNLSIALSYESQTKYKYGLAVKPFCDALKMWTINNKTNDWRNFLLLLWKDGDSTELDKLLVKLAFLASDNDRFEVINKLEILCNLNKYCSRSHLRRNHLVVELCGSEVIRRFLESI